MAKDNSPINRRSRNITEGVARAPNRSMYYAMGYQEEDFGKPMIGVANGDLASKMTSAWSFLTLAGPRYAIRNAGEDLMVNLAIGQSP